MTSEHTRIWLSILLMIAVIYSVRLIPMLVFRRTIRNRFVRSFLYYVPYVTLAVMTFPAILHDAGDLRCGIAALAAGILSAWFSGDLFLTAVICCAAAFLTGVIF